MGAGESHAAIKEYNIRDADVAANSIILAEDGTKHTRTEQTSRFITAMNTLIGDPLTGNTGGTLYLPGGRYEVNGPILNLINQSVSKRLNLTIRGDSIDSTIINSNATGSALGVIVAQATGSAQLSNITIKDLTIETEGTEKNLLHFERVSRVLLDRVHLTSTLGMGLHGKCLVDSLFHDVHFNFLGTDAAEPNGFPAVLIESTANGTGDLFSARLIWESCRFESLRNIGLRLKNMRIALLSDCKFHGLGDGNASPTNTHIEIIDSYLTSIYGARLTNPGNGIIYAQGSRGLLLVNSSLEGAGDENTATPDRIAVQLVNCADYIIVGNNFSVYQPTLFGPDDITGVVKGKPGKNDIDLSETTCSNYIRRWNVARNASLVNTS